MAESLSNFIINEDSTLKDALLQMTSTHRGILLVTDSEMHLMGVLADGDVRRALLDDVSLNIPVTQVMNLNPIVAQDRQQAEQILDKDPYLILIPVVNEEGKLTGILSALNGKSFHEKETGTEQEATNESAAQSKVKYLAIIPARGGSKRIPGKNLSKIGSETLLSLAIKSASESEYIDHITVSTDNKEIAKEAEDNGVKIPWYRPDSLSGDNAKTVDVMYHALEMFKNEHSYTPDNIVLLEPTAPLRNAGLIDRAIELFNDETADSLVSVNQIKHIYHPEELLVAENSKYLRPYLSNRTFDSRKLRNEQDPLFIQNGLVYITRTEVLEQQKSIYGDKVLKFETDPSLFADIDEVEDLELARMKYAKLSQVN